MLIPLNDVLTAWRPYTHVVRPGALARMGEDAEKEKKGDQDSTSQAKRVAAQKVAADAAKAAKPKTAQEKRAATIAKKRKEAMRQAMAKAQQARKERKLRRKEAEKEKHIRKSKARASDKAGQVNAQLAHCMLALKNKRGKSTRGSWNICRASLTKHGYLKGPYREAGKLSDVKPTQKGVRRAMQHAFEKRPLNGGIKGTPAEKFKKFRKMFKDIEPTV